MAEDSNYFVLGQKFSSYDGLEEKIKAYEKKNFINNLWKRDSKTVAAAKKRLDRCLSNEIKYYSLTYSCIHGGRKFRARGDGKRLTQ